MNVQKSARVVVSSIVEFVYVVVQFGFWFNLDFPLFDIHYHILALKRTMENPN